MSTFIIKKGKHRAKPLRVGVYFNKNRIAFKVMFDSSCKYFIDGEDMMDINKLFGIAFVPWYLIPFAMISSLFISLFSNLHHKDSARYGWRFNINLNKFELFSYCYVNGVRKTELITTVFLNQWFDAELVINRYNYEFNVIKNGDEFNGIVEKTHNKKIGYRLNPFFGGNPTAVQDTRIEMKKI